MATILSSTAEFDAKASLAKFKMSKALEKTSVQEISWEMLCRPILLNALIDSRSTDSVLQHLESEGVPLGEVPKSKRRTVHRWLARARYAIHLPELPPGGKMTGPGYLEAVRRWKALNGTLTDEELLSGERIQRVDYSDLNFLSATDAYAPRTTKKPKSVPARAAKPTLVAVPGPAASPPTPNQSHKIGAVVTPDIRQEESAEPATQEPTPNSRPNPENLADLTTDEIYERIHALPVDEDYPAKFIALKSAESKKRTGDEDPMPSEISNWIPAITRKMNGHGLSWAPPD